MEHAIIVGYDAGPAPTSYAEPMPPANRAALDCYAQSFPTLTLRVEALERTGGGDRTAIVEAG